MKCQNCQCIVTQAEADEAHEIRPHDQDTLCPACAKSLNEADAEADECCPTCGHPADNSSGHGHCDDPCHRPT